MALKFHKVTSLPGTLAADSFYFVVNGSYAESYLTTSDGTAKLVGNSTMINTIATTIVNDAINALSSNPIDIVADIAARDTLIADAITNRMILVTDATADTTVASGAALYVYDDGTSTTTKIAEYESMDVILQWSDISGKPTSSAAQIDDAVAKRHEHANLTTLDKLGESGGKLIYDGADVSSTWTTVNW